MVSRAGLPFLGRDVHFFNLEDLLEAKAFLAIRLLFRFWTNKTVPTRATPAAVTDAKINSPEVSGWGTVRSVM